jgi:DeoR/GlpR family transcriptional regulator of sugar metabolism
MGAKKAATPLTDRIAQLLQKDHRGLTVKELAGLTGVSTITVAKALAELNGGGKLTIRPVGSAKLHYWRDHRDA